MLKIYGSARSSAGRCYWCMEEAGVPYETQEINFREKEHKSPKYLAMNPNGKFPTLVDGDFILWESMAINSYIAENHMPELLGTEKKEKALVQQWSFWSLAELQPPIIDIFIQLVFVPEDKRSPEVIEAAKDKLAPMIKVLDDSLSNGSYLAGDKFTLADLNAASVVSICDNIKYDISSFSNIQKWLGVISERPAFKRYSELRK